MDEIIKNLNLPQENHPEKLFVINLLDLFLDNTQPSVVIDVGCGKNKTVSWCVGVDINPVTDTTASADSLPYVNSSVDCIISRHSIEHLIDPIVLLKEWHRVLKPKGFIIFILPDHEHIDTMQHILSYEQHLHAYTRQSFANIVNVTKLFSFMPFETVIQNWSFGGVLHKR